MAENANQHYVPKFYFKLFNGGEPRINALLTKDGRIVRSAPIKGQCARNMFYGSVEIEKEFSRLEGSHASALRALVEVGTTGDTTKFSKEQIPSLLQAIAFQRARTMLELEKNAPAMESFLLHAFTEFLVSSSFPPDDVKKYLAAIARGEVKVTDDPLTTVFNQIDAGLESAALLCDLQPCIIRNHTDYPFIFSDSPVVFYNMYYRRITDRGVLGFQTPGLQIFLPLTPVLQLMMFDPKVYGVSSFDGPFCDVFGRADVSQLNALQLHHSHQAVYFADANHAEYVEALYGAHKSRLKKPVSEFRARRDLLVKNEPVDSDLLHVFDRQLSHDLSLTFINCTPVSPRNYVFRHRSPQFVAEHRRLQEARGDQPDPAYRAGLDHCIANRTNPEPAKKAGCQ